MELKEFIKKVVADIVEAIDESSATASRNISLEKRDEKRTIEFDVAVTAEETSKKGGSAGVRVLSIGVDGGMGKEIKNSTVSRITFGVDVDHYTKARRALVENQPVNRPRINPGR